MGSQVAECNVPETATEKVLSSGLQKSEDNLAIGYLRAFVTLLVLAHHSVLAYVQVAPAPAKSLLVQPRWWEAFPIVDPHKSGLFLLFVSFNDIFFMSLMFLLSGLFVWNSIARKGAARFANDRALRLGIPFVAAAALVAPLAYYPAYLQTGSHGVSGFVRSWLSLGQWPAGPAWFVWVLLSFDCAVAWLFAKAPRASAFLEKLSGRSAQHPARFFWLLVSCSAAVYLPLSLAFGPMHWTAFGPFVFQTSRILHYFVYFLAGISLGILGLDRGLISAAGKLPRRALRWSARALLAFSVVGITFLVTQAHAGALYSVALNSLMFAVSCAASCFALLALFVRFVKTRRKIYDSLRQNAYGIYLVHYAFVSWLQYALLPASLPGLLKGILVFLGTTLLSWGLVSGLRKMPYVSRVL